MNPQAPLFSPIGIGYQSKTGIRLGQPDLRLTRTNYFDGQLLQADDLNRDLDYLDARLRELGQALGSGVIKGLDLELDPAQPSLLRITPGLAITPGGRVLQLTGEPREIRLLRAPLQRPQILRASLKRPASLRSLPSLSTQQGLYAAVIRYAEKIDRFAEVYPETLAEARTFQPNTFAEGAELALVPLPIGDPRHPELPLRAQLVRQLILAQSHLSLLDQEEVPLGVLAFDSQGQAMWADQGLVRRPLGSRRLQEDLATHHQELFTDVLAWRKRNNQPPAFAAQDHFQVLPPWGPVPKASVDPVAGRQSYFPRAFEVAIAPVRQWDLPVLQEDALRMAPIDLTQDQDVDVMLLVPLDDVTFAQRARQLELRADQAPILPARTAESRISLRALDGLALRLFPIPPVHRLDTDATIWRGLWDALADDKLIFVRRPPRAAETHVSAVVLAQGFGVPAPATAAPPLPDPTLEEAAALRGAAPQVAGDLNANLGTRADARRAILHLLILVPATFDAALWPTLVHLSKTPDALLTCLSHLQPQARAGRSIPTVMVAQGPNLGLTDALLKLWKSFVP